MLFALLNFADCLQTAARSYVDPKTKAYATQEMRAKQDLILARTISMAHRYR